MKELLASGRVIDVALVVIGVEFVVLIAMGRRAATRLRPIDVVGQLLAGALLLLALRVALAGGSVWWIAALLTASFPAHALDMARRLRQTQRYTRSYATEK